VKNELTVTSPDEAVADQSASECYALIYNSSSDSLLLRNVRAVIGVGSLTSEQYRYLDSEFKKRYTETKTEKMYVVFVLEQTPLAYCLSNIPENVPRYGIDYLSKQNEVIIKQGEVRNDHLKTITEVLVPVLNEARKGTYPDTLRALVDANHPDTKYRHWAKWKSGMGYAAIAKSEHPEWAEGDAKVAQQKYDAEAEVVRKHVERMEQKMQEQVCGKPSKKTKSKKITKKTAKQKKTKSQTATRVRKTKG
jgi:Arc/MetJ-type ribon-helix-helix transcriptional regulator